MKPEENQPPKVFISYSWTSAAHQDWVTSLAEQLMDPGGVEVVYDLWDLLPGQDKYAYMERMVTDESISKVLVVSDRTYAEKADRREGGVGTESVIISKEVYEEVAQEKFIALPTEVDEQGRPFLPTFMAARKYFDFSREEVFYERFEELVRYLHGKSLHRRPIRSRPPAYILEEVGELSRTRPRLRAFENAVRSNSTTATGLLDDYLDSVADAVGELLLEATGYEPDFHEHVIASADRFLPIRNEFVSFVLFVAQYGRGEEPYEQIHRFFERLAQFRSQHDQMPGKSESGTDNIGYVLWELFLHTVAVLIARQRFSEANILLARPYFVSSGRHADSGVLRSFGVFDPSLRSLDTPAQGFGRQARSIRNDLLEQRPQHPEISLRELVQADFVLGVRGHMDAKGDFDFPWDPRLLVYAHNQTTFEIFLRGASRQFFERLKVLLGVENKDELVERFGATRMPTIEGIWGTQRFENFLNLEHLATR